MPTRGPFPGSTLQWPGSLENSGPKARIATSGNADEKGKLVEFSDLLVAVVWEAPETKYFSDRLIDLPVTDYIL